MLSRRFRRSALQLSLAALMSAAAIGCAGPQEPSPEGYTEAAEYQFDRADHYFKRKDFERARNMYQAIARQYPFSPFAARSELRIADTYYGEKAYSAAIESYRAFSRLRPRHESIPYADFRIVEAYLKMMPKERTLAPPTHERDLTDALLAYREARRYIIRYREGDYVEQAKEIVSSVANRLADHELYVGRYYERREHYVGAMRRYQYLASSFPESDRIPVALLRLGEAAYQADRFDVVREAYGQMSNLHGDSPLLVELSRVLENAERKEAAMAASVATEERSESEE